MATEPTTLPDYADEALRLMERLQGLAQITDGLGAASETLIIASNVLDETNRQIGTLNASASTAVAAIDRLQPDRLRGWIESELASLRQSIGDAAARGEEGARNVESAVQTLGRQTAADLESVQIEFNERLAELIERVTALRSATTNACNELNLESIKRFDAHRLQLRDGFDAMQALAVAHHDDLLQQADGHHSAAAAGVADAAARVLDAVDQTRQQIAAGEAAMRQAIGEIRTEQTALADALARLQRDQQALAGRARAIEAKAEQIAAAADLTRKSAATIEQAMQDRLPALAADVAALRAQMASAERTALIRQIVLLVVTILLIALLNGMLVRFVGMR